MNFVKALLYGLQLIPRKGVPGLLIDSGSNSFCVGVTKTNQCFQAAALYGSGRLVTFAHNAYVLDATANPKSDVDRRTNRLLVNSLLWASSSECELIGNESKQCNAVCERQSDIIKYPFNWGQDCQQPIVIGGLGFSAAKFDKAFQAFESVVKGLFRKGSVYEAATVANVSALVATQPDVILWTNGVVDSEKLTDASNDHLDPRAEQLLYYVQQGGGLVLAVCPWGWESLSNFNVADQSLFNAVTSAMGINLTGDYVEGFDGDNIDVSYSLGGGEAATKLAKMRSSVTEVMTKPNVNLKTFNELLTSYMGYPASTFLPAKKPLRAWLPDSDPEMKELLLLIEQVAQNIGQHSLNFPLVTGKGATTLTQSTAAAMLYLVWLRRMAEVKQPRELLAITPSIDTFPGSVGTGQRNTGMVTSLLNVRARWQTLGIYAAPGEPVSITIADQSLLEFPGLTLTVQIGSHTDSLAITKDNYKLDRHPKITNKRTWTPRKVAEVDDKPMASPATLSNSIQVGSVYGGILYVQIEKGGDAINTPKAVVFNVVGGVPMPFYSHLKERRSIDPSDELYGVFNQYTDSYPFWTSTWEQRAAAFVDAPWTDLEGRYVTLTVPTSILQDMSQQELWGVMDFWDTMLYNELWLSDDLPDYKYKQEHLTCDKQISVGYMHSGYPVMCFTDIVTPKDGKRLPALMDLEGLKQNPMWGVYHEFGHNRQKPAWTWQDMTEVTCNIFSLFSCYKMNGFDVYHAPWYVNQIADQLKYLEDPSTTYANYRGSAGIALGGFAVFAQSIGNWDILHQIFAKYKAEKINPTDNNGKINEWIKQTSLAVGMDLRPYYKQWKWPIDDNRLSAINGLPKWSGNVANIIRAGSSR